MVTAKVYSAANVGFEGRIIEVECDTTNGLPGIVIVGLANKAIDESKERIRSSIKNSELVIPRKRITLNLAPANLPKDGTCYDLPMAIAVLAAGKQIQTYALKDSLFVGELSLDGLVRPVQGVITHAEAASLHGFKRIFVPVMNAKQAALIDGIEVIPVSSLKELCQHINDIRKINPVPTTTLSRSTSKHVVDFSDVYGQVHAKRALEVAVAGYHNILLSGPPGAGKTMMARALLSILPSPSVEEIIAITKLHSLAGELVDQIQTERPFRTPHHTASTVALIGGGKHPKLGEISLANKGILFLDEFPEYTRSSLEALRQPLEDRIITVARAEETVVFPADFMLVATQNPCPCGYYMDPDHSCTCSPSQIVSYNKKISGPLLDRIDLVVPVSKVEHKHLLPTEATTRVSESEEILQRIMTARNLQQKRFKSKTKINAHMNNRDIAEKAGLKHESRLFLEKAAQKLALSARSYMKVIRVARTIADLESTESIEINHISEALSYRPR